MLNRLFRRKHKGAFADELRVMSEGAAGMVTAFATLVPDDRKFTPIEMTKIEDAMCEDATTRLTDAWSKDDGAREVKALMLPALTKLYRREVRKHLHTRFAIAPDMETVGSA